VLLGDKDQLSSVEAGAVLGELCAGNGRCSPAFAAKLSRLTGEQVPGDATRGHPLGDNVALLSHSYRFGGDSGIGRLAALVNQENLAGLKTLLSQSLEDVCWREIPGSGVVDALLERMSMGYEAYLEAVARQASLEDILIAFGGFRVLCAQRAGELGMENLNGRFESLVKARARHPDSEWYPGRAIMVIRNDYQLRLFNGDVGVTLPDPGDPKRLRVFFQIGGAPRSVALTRLPEYEPVFAMTVHKSQGSEFDRVLMVSPTEETPVMTRELVYTAVTRAKVGLEIWGNQDSLLRAVRRPVQRASGLGAKLAGQESIE
jgi:exodeoxyribonuclease V alpha subunit